VIELNWTIWIQFANFFVLLAVLNVILYKPLREVMKRREETVSGGHDRAQELEGQINEKMSRYQEQLQEARARGSEERANLRKAALQEEGTILGAAQEEASRHLQGIKGQVAAEAETAREALKAETDALASQIASRVLGRELK